MKTKIGSVQPLNMDNNDVLIYDIETETFGARPNAKVDKLKIFGFYSYKINKYCLIPFTDKEAIQKVINNHKFIVGFNNEKYDDPILEREGISLEYKRKIDLRKIIKMRAGSMITEKGMLGNVLMKYSLDYITRFLDLVDDKSAKGEMDYNILKKNKWTPEEVKEIKEYTIRDLEITKKLYEWVSNYFDAFKDFVPKKDIEGKYYLTDSMAKFGYKADCHALGLEPIYNFDFVQTPEDERISGGYCSYPAGEKFSADETIKEDGTKEYKNLIIQLDFSCLPTDTVIRCKTKNNNYYNKKIQNLKPGDLILGENKNEVVGGVNKEYYNGELIKIELDNGKIIKCTPEHKFPIIRDGNRLNVEAQNILEIDDMITTLSKFKDNNRNFKGKIKKMCEVCGKEFEVFPSHIKQKSCGDSECVNYLRKINNTNTNYGKTKYNCAHLRKMSNERKGKTRSKEIRHNISEGTKKKMWDPTIRNRFLEANKNRDTSFTKTIEWKHKIALSRMNNIKNGKFVYNGIKFRSNWEIIFAKGLDKHNIKWKYEPKIFELKDGSHYLPDFYLPEHDKWIEIKGYMYDQSRKKIQQFMKEHNNFLLLNDLEKIKNAGAEWSK